MNFKDLTPEQQLKARNCKTAEDVLELVKSEGYELSVDELDAVAGGAWDIVAELDEFFGDCENFQFNDH